MSQSLTVRRLALSGTALIGALGLTLAAWTGFRTAEAPAATPADLRADLLAAEASARNAGRSSGVMVVSAVELGETAAPARAASPAPRVPAPRVTTRRVTERSPAPRVRVERAPASVERAPVVVPEPVVAEMPAPPEEPTRTEPVVAAPSRTDRRVEEPARRRGGWSSTADVIRNAPFPINP